jgi:NAD(P)H dehydrogenase (quinone)
MRVFIVFAHHEPSSFNGAMVRAAKRRLLTAGHEVMLSDLHLMAFDPVSDRRNFNSVANPARLDQQVEERRAAAEGGFVPAIAAEIEKLLWCDLLILQFPVWWMGMPAIMKGWIDKVFALDIAYGGGRWFDRGRLSGKSAMLSLTVGGDADAYSRDGLYGPIDLITHPINHGVLGFTGFSVIEPFVVYGPGRMSEADRIATLADYADFVGRIEQAPRLPQLRSEEFDGFVCRRSAI